MTEKQRDTDSLASHIERATQRLHSLRQSREGSTQTPEEAMQQALAELETMMEEMRVAEEEMRVAEEILHQQTGELENARMVIEQERRRYVDLFEFAPDAYVVTDVYGTIDETNRAALALMHTDLRAMIGKPLALRVIEAERRAFRLFLNHLKSAETTQEFETVLLLRDGTQFDASMAVTVMRNPARQAIALRWLIRDITVGKAALRTSEERNRLIVESITDYAVLTLDEEGCVTDWNTGAERILGWRAEEIVGENGAIFFTPEDRAQGVLTADMKQARNEGRASGERWHLRKDGSRFWSDCVMMPLHSERPEGFVKILRDMTAERLAEEERRQTAERLADQARREAILQERNRMAREIHDTLAQGFVGTKLHLDVIEESLGDPPDTVRPHIEKARILVRDSLAEARRSVQELRASALEQGDLASALRALVENMTQDTQIRGAFQQHGQLRALPPIIEDELLRIGQEAMTNALRHAAPSSITITLACTAEIVTLNVDDDGRGFDPATVGGYGLRGMRERAARIDAQLILDTVPGQGTRLLVMVPIPGVSRSRRRDDVPHEQG